MKDTYKSFENVLPSLIDSIVEKQDLHGAVSVRIFSFLGDPFDLCTCFVESLIGC